MDRGYQSHNHFDQWQHDGKMFMCRIKAGTKKTIVKKNRVAPDSIVFFDATVVLGTTANNITKQPVRVVGYEADRVKYWIAANRHDLNAEQIAAAYKLRWNIENFFAWCRACHQLSHMTEAARCMAPRKETARLSYLVAIARYCLSLAKKFSIIARSLYRFLSYERWSMRLFIGGITASTCAFSKTFSTRSAAS